MSRGTQHLILSRMDACPCGLPDGYQQCCGRFHNGEEWPSTAEQLMRSRYSAFVMMDRSYLLASWHPRTRPTNLSLEPRKWLGLKVLGAEQMSSTSASVEFVARSRVAGAKADRLHETSRFILEQGRWLYLEPI